MSWSQDIHLMVILGVYSLNLNDKSQLPNFNSVSKESFILFDDIKCTGVVNLIDDFIFTD